ncbi:MAG: hydantoinase B/oxoprolinase family protein, partial [Candidatus Eremiobacteraeota bacterium]|nr:hydantoinase B/oxoprolinase family protein [Candidatus Eremiobacteraeota bacterium]
FTSVVKEMGEMLRRTALSTNVKERLDFSCAFLDRNGELVVNAPHIPVHLGAISLCVQRIIKDMKLSPGDVIVTNHPAYGGSHLPDVTVITPVFTGSEVLLGFVASRAHHAEIGGTMPGSMPPSAGRLIEEGVIIPPTYIVEKGRDRFDLVRKILTGGPYPSRAVEDNLADLNAAIAANQLGVINLRKLAHKHGEDTLFHYMLEIKKHAGQKIRKALKKIPDGKYEAIEYLDDGSPLCVRLDIKGDKAHISFEGSSGVHPGNLNTTPAVVRSVVIYVLRLLLDEPLPLNEGFWSAVTLDIPGGILDPGFDREIEDCPAIVGGNVETSQRLVDTMLKALEMAACSQGTMNNVIFGTDDFTYYETVCGGCGAGPGYDGASAVHSHMTNTRITDPEIVEHRYPVRIEKFAIRENSGGQGRHRGGDGTVREISFLRHMSLSILGQHRNEGPYGLKGGRPGKPGKQYVIKKGGEIINLGPIDRCEVGPGDRFIIKTPGGGGYGMPSP